MRELYRFANIIKFVPRRRINTRATSLWYNTYHYKGITIFYDGLVKAMALMKQERPASRALGIDIGSTTVKVALLEDGRVLHERYERHYSQARQKILEMLSDVEPLAKDAPLRVTVSGSAGIGLAEAAGLPFEQEVFVVGELVRTLEPDTSAVVELGGEDAKIIFFDGGMDERMNGSCAGGTGAFIDQMATLLDVDVAELDRLSLNYTRIYSIASRCGVFAKTDIQPLLNQGARKEDVAMSIFQAIVNQTIAGLAQGRKIEGKVLFLGGPLYYCKGLRIRFQETLGLSDENALFPEWGRFAVARGAAMYASRTQQTFTLSQLRSRLGSARVASGAQRMPALFDTQAEYDAFAARHARASVPRASLESYRGGAWLGIDCGSTTTKLALISSKRELLYTYYASNNGDPVEIVRRELENIYRLTGGNVRILGSAVTGYGEELIRHAFHVDIGVVETIAHFAAARHFCPEVDFILDIGGQDIKCFRIANGAIDGIMLNEACSSGCGSFIETFARSMNMDVEAFARRGLFARAPVDLGSRCTVFMNSSVKQAQRDGATVEDISAGLSVSVVKNALYKVIRAGSADELGQNVVVQGGTFHNDAILRAFERELGREVIRPDISGLMGAYGAALCAMRLDKSTLLSPGELARFSHTSRPAVCNGCENRCKLTVNTFADGGRYISGNRCERGAGNARAQEDVPNLYAYKREALMNMGGGEARRGRIGLPLALGMYELLPLWSGIFRALGFEVVLSGMSDRSTYEAGQFTIPSDTACYPAKIMHGHIVQLLEKGVDAVFYPCLTHNFDEGGSDNHFNCPVVAYYSELLRGNMPQLTDQNFLYPHLDICDARSLAQRLREALSPRFGAISPREMRAAVSRGMADYEAYMAGVRTRGEEALAWARAHKRRVMVLAGRPYHIDAEIGHGIDQLATSLGFVVVSEDSVYHLADTPQVHVLNQWTYHARLYRAAAFAATQPDVEFVQLVSFGCGVDAITTDESRDILERAGKYYTQIKIDEIANLGAVKIRLRSLLGALELK